MIKRLSTPLEKSRCKRLKSRPWAQRSLTGSKFLLVLVLITGWFFGGFPPAEIHIAEAVTTETFTTSTTWTAPTGVTSVTAEVWGGGGGGGGENATTDGGGGGGGGAYSIKAGIVVVPATGYTVTVGAGGTGSAGCTASTAGGDSSFVNTATVLAKGGSPGACSTGTPPAGGAGGASASGVGDTKFSGGQGEIGRNNNAGLGGYGGSSAGTAAVGFSGPQTWSTATYPTASTPAGGGHGGNGGATANAAGSAPASGNGGGGGGAADGTNISGGAGAVGKVILTYNKPPNVPTQDSPANAATGVSVTPTFLMTATDADTTVDNLSYKVTIYSNSACTTVAQTNDQAVSSTGWTGSNATCTASPTACYTSGTQGSFLTQTALSASTQYWWKASAKDPDGNGTFTDSSTCNTFTTGAAASLTFVVSTDVFPALTPGSPVFATSTLSVNTDNSTGWNVTLSRDDADTTMDLDTDATVNITDQTDWIPGSATTTAGNAARISSLINSQKALAFRTMTASGTASFISTSWWGATDAYVDSATTLWAGIASSTAANLKIGNSSVSSGGSAKLNTVLYYLDVPSTQKSGAYSGGITYTATMNP